MPDYIVTLKTEQYIRVNVNNDERFGTEYLYSDALSITGLKEREALCIKTERGYDCPEWLSSTFGVFDAERLFGNVSRPEIYDDFYQIYPYKHSDHLLFIGFSREYCDFIEQVYNMKSQELWKHILRYKSLYCEHILMYQRLLIENPDENILKYINGYAIEKVDNQYYIIRKANKCGQLSLY